MNSSWSKKVAVASVAALALVSAACGGDDDDSNADAATTTTASSGSGGQSGDSTTTSVDLSAPDHVKLQVCGGVSTNTAVYYAAEGMGLLDEISQRFDTDVELDGAFAGGTECVAAFTGGEDDFTSMDVGAVAVMAAAGEDVTTIMDLHNGMALVIVGAKSEESERGTDLANWEGATFAITSPGASTEKVPHALLDAQGVDNSSITYLPVGNVAAMSAALQSGQVDGTATTPTAAVALFNAGVGYQVINSNDPAVTGPLVGQLLGPASLSGKPDFMEQYPGLTQAIVDALHQALNEIQAKADDPDAVLALFTDDVQSDIGDGFADQWDLTKQALENVDPTITADEAHNTIDYQTTYGGSDLTNVPDTLIDNTWAVQSFEDLGLPAGDDVPVHPLQGS